MYQYNNTMQKITAYDDVTKENIKDHNPNWLQISDHLCRMHQIYHLIFGQKFVWR